MYMGIKNQNSDSALLLTTLYINGVKKMQCNAIILNTGLKLKHVQYYSILKCCTIDLAIFVKQQEQCIVL